MTPVDRMNPATDAVQRHRLVQPYRGLIVALWLLPIPLLLVAVLIGRGLSVHLLDPRFWLPLLLAALPAWYVWQEGIDVRRDGLYIRAGIPRFYPYDALLCYDHDTRPHRRWLVIWSRGGGRVFRMHLAHLTEPRRLVQALRDHLPNRAMP
jgi:hypothetical protein